MAISTDILFLPWIISFLRVLFHFFSQLFLKLAILFAWTFARVIGLTFFILLVGPVICIEWISSSSTSTNSDQKPKEGVGVIDVGELTGWMRIRLCKTDEISELDLDECAVSGKGIEDDFLDEGLEMMIRYRERKVERWLGGVLWEEKRPTAEKKS